MFRLPRTRTSIEGVRPAEVGKTCKVAVSRVQHATIFDRQRRNFRIAHQSARSLSCNHHPSEERPLLFTRHK